MGVSDVDLAAQARDPWCYTTDELNARRERDEREDYNSRESGLLVSRIAFGTWQLGGDWGHFGQDGAVNAIRRARDLGVNFFDTAHAYGFGASEILLGRAIRDELPSTREDLVTATKGGLHQTDAGLVSDASPEWLRRGVDASPTALGLDHIDLYQVPWPDPAAPFAETAGALAERITEAKTNHVGVLVYGPLALGLPTGTMTEDTTFASDDWRSGSDVFTGDAYRLILAIVRDLAMFAADRGITVSQLAIAWTLAQPGVHVAIVGARRTRHVDDSLAAADISVSGAELAEFAEIMTSAVAAAGPSPESVR